MFIIKKLCPAFQKRNIDFSFAKCRIDITIKWSEDFSFDYGENNKKYMENVIEEIQEKNEQF